MSGVFQPIRSQIGWNWNQPASSTLTLSAGGLGLERVDADRGAPEAGDRRVGHQLGLAGPLEGQEPHAALSTPAPTVSIPWLRRMTALCGPGARPIQAPSSLSSTTPR